ncbi:MAG: AAA family ATPase [Gemmataceae bacterium]
MNLSVRSVQESNLPPTAVDWLWPPYLAAGKLTLLDGDPGCGKSLLTIDLAARLSRGLLGTGQPIRTLLLNAEDDPADTILPRLRSADADPNHVFVPDGDPAELLADLPQLEALVRTQHIGLLIVDPLPAFLATSMAAAGVVAARRALGPVIQMAVRTQTALLAVRHLTKRTGERAVYRGLGSIGIAGLARIVLVADQCRHGSNRYTLTVVKSNLTVAPEPLEYRLADRGGAAVVEWLEAGGPAGPAPAGVAGQPDRPGVVRATLWLLEALANGPRPAAELLVAAAAAGIRERTLEVAKRQLKIESKFQRTPDDRRLWLWCPPHEPDPSFLDPLPDLPPLEDPMAKGFPADLSDAGREVINRERLAWAARVLSARAKMTP